MVRTHPVAPAVEGVRHTTPCDGGETTDIILSTWPCYVCTPLTVVGALHVLAEIPLAPAVAVQGYACLATGRMIVVLIGCEVL